jgi:hypothetical protein
MTMPATPTKVYLPFVAFEHEGDNILSVCLNVEDARQALVDGPSGYDMEGVMVYEINGPRLYDDPDDFLTDLS